MSSAAQIAANRLNAQSSTGPKSESGKATVSQNATRHGLSSGNLPLSAAERPLYQELEDALRAELNPSGALQESLFLELAAAAWKRNVVNRLLAEAAGTTEALFDDVPSDRLRKLLRHKADIDRAFNRSLRQLKDLQTADLQRRAILFAAAEKFPGISLAGYPGLASYQKFTKQSQPLPSGFEMLTQQQLENAQREAEQARIEFRRRNQ
ncbi:MAG: hypothetical protein JNK48_25970 [Bryobacterales bacterium]|nr:hypothetical protein [Bryobacterales bacterium]